MDKQEAVEDNDPYSILSIFEIERITENTIEELPDQCKSIFKLSRINGLKNQEIADKLDISVRTVETLSGFLKKYNTKIYQSCK